MDLLPEQKEYEPGEKARFQVRTPVPQRDRAGHDRARGRARELRHAPLGAQPGDRSPDRRQLCAERVRVGARGARPGGGLARLACGSRAQARAPVALRGRRGHGAGRSQQARFPARRRADPRRLVGAATARSRSRRRARPIGCGTRRSSTLQVRGPNGRRLPAGAELAFAAVDEGLLELRPNDSWALLDAMMDERPIEVWTSTAQMQVVGKRHYGRKAVADRRRRRARRRARAVRHAAAVARAREARRRRARAHRGAAQRFADELSARRGGERRRRVLRDRPRDASARRRS